ncbi:ICOS ligand-like isoform X2 [Archocentrus centrarchus]|uniref:ICOS ligand-like isoform X2 n=1 Tax=Archocentrus centrarchus TaxID=63155 RepID=UPI0011EA152E|nr:ICOS ligand-like isoform X2 [Archocentrus centrarchus]
MEEADDQDPSFKNRVELRDRQMKDGDVSVILKNVTINDAGTYECRVFTEETRTLKLIINITLRVVAPPPGPSRGAPVKLICGLGVAAVLFVAVVSGGILIYRKYIQNQKPNR